MPTNDPKYPDAQIVIQPINYQFVINPLVLPPLEKLVETPSAPFWLEYVQPFDPFHEIDEDGNKVLSELGKVVLRHDRQDPLTMDFERFFPAEAFGGAKPVYPDIIIAEDFPRGDSAAPSGSAHAQIQELALSDSSALEALGGTPSTLADIE